MSKNKNFFARAFDAVVDARTRQAERYVANYIRDHDLPASTADRRFTDR